MAGPAGLRSLKPLVPEAHRLIGQRDPEGADFMVLVLQTGLTFWTEDRDFDLITGLPAARASQLVPEQ